MRPDTVHQNKSEPGNSCESSPSSSSLSRCGASEELIRGSWCMLVRWLKGILDCALSAEEVGEDRSRYGWTSVSSGDCSNGSGVSARGGANDG